MPGENVSIKRELITMEESLGISGGTYTGSSDVFSDGIGYVKLEGY